MPQVIAYIMSSKQYHCVMLQEQGCGPGMGQRGTGRSCLQTLPVRKYSQKACITFRAMWGDTRQWPPWTQQRVIFELQFVLPPPLPLPCHLVISIITLIGETLLGWAGLGWAGLGWAELGWGGEECDVINIAHCTALPLLTTSHTSWYPMKGQT